LTELAHPECGKRFFGAPGGLSPLKKNFPEKIAWFGRYLAEGFVNCAESKRLEPENMNRL